VTEGRTKKLLVIQVAALGYDLLRSQSGSVMCGLTFRPTSGPFPGLTCTVQAGFRTASAPSAHGMVGNGFMNRSLRRPLFWEQSAGLVGGQRIWEGHRKRGGRVGLFFWQQSMGEAVDQLLSPAPVHKHHGGMIDTCYSKPDDLYDTLTRAVGRGFLLRHYWGPLASVRSSAWIADATAQVLASGADAPEVCFTYLPALDYDLQRFGPEHKRSAAAFQGCAAQLEYLTAMARKHDYDILVFGDYAIAGCERAALPNRALARAGLLRTREIRGMQYPDLYTSRAFAVVDHELAHVYVRRAEDLEETSAVLRQLDGIGEVLDASGMLARGLAHPNAGELVAVAADGWWLAYPWWNEPGQAPDYAGHVDIHNKPGYDPCELFWGWPPGSVSQNVSRIKGSHGRGGPGREVAWASTFLEGDVGGIVELAKKTADWLNGET
jgi:predicted AlkP superfamily pyrophosphatase or phosphodiesterase